MVTLPELNNSFIARQDYFMLFESKLCDRGNFMSYLFINPVKVIKAASFSEAKKAFRQIDKYSKDFYLAGYFSYELGYYFEKGAFKGKCRLKTPLIHLAVFDKRFYFNHKNGQTNMNIPGLFLNSGPENNFYIYNLELNITPDEYKGKVRKIKDYIRKGDTYQVNFTAKYDFSFLGSALELYRRLARRQHVQYSAFCKLKEHHIISLSPELFLRRQGQRVFSQPMKGTIKRGGNPEEDRQNSLKLKASLKNRAENLMIIDLVRNDLGRISKVSSIKVSEPFKVRRYETILQMTSQVNGVLKRGISYLDIFSNIFPGGSVTGAPKIRTMQIIRKLESSPRGVYCGALGFIAKGKEAVFNLPIRTLSISEGKGEMGVGSGIVSDSSPDSEFKECRLKAKFLTGIGNDFSLVETIVWDRGFKFLKEHLKRINASAGYFGFACSLNRIRDKLRELGKSLKSGKRYKIRILLDKNGRLRKECSGLNPCAQIKYAAISRHRVDPESIFLCHKTTNRALYDREYAHYRAKGYFDVIFLNTKNEVTEGAISNVIIEKSGVLYTPPLSSGLLPGVYRGYLLRKGMATEKVIYPADLLAAEKVFLCNSVRGLTQVKLKIKLTNQDNSV